MKMMMLTILATMGFALAAKADNGWYGERAYLTCNDDVRRAVQRGEVRSGYDHYLTHGRYEPRVTDGKCFASDAPYWFNDRCYLMNNPDVRQAVRRGQFKSGWHHFRAFGMNEDREVQCMGIQ